MIGRVVEKCILEAEGTGIGDENKGRDPVERKGLGYI